MWGGGEGAHTEQYYMERKIKIFVQKDVKIKLIRGKGQKTDECLQKEWLESKCSRKCSPTAHCIVEGPQKIGENVYDRLQMDHENVR